MCFASERGFSPNRNILSVHGTNLPEDTSVALKPVKDCILQASDALNVPTWIWQIIYIYIYISWLCILATRAEKLAEERQRKETTKEVEARSNKFQGKKNLKR